MEQNDKMVMVWTSGDKEVALKMVFMYTLNSKKKGWWPDVTLVVWGPSTKLLCEDKELQDYLAKMKEEGVNLQACKACSDMYGLSDELEKMGIEVLFVGQTLTNYLKEGRKVLTV
jgi:hypothetical protein